MMAKKILRAATASCLLALGALQPLCGSMYGIAESRVKQVDGLLPVQRLLPGLKDMPGIDPVVPSNFVVGSANGQNNIYDSIYWGKATDLKDFFQSGSNRGPLIRVACANSKQIENGDIFSSEKRIIEEFKRKGYGEIKLRRMWWGQYPVLVFEGLHPQIGWQRAAWQGLNDGKNGVLYFAFVEPANKDFASKSELAIWDRFLTETTELPEQLFFKAKGQDIKVGETIVTACGAKVGAVAEKRKSDGTLLVAMVPITPNTFINVEEVIEGVMGAKWHRGDALVKIPGIITFCDKNITNVVSQVTSVLVKEVEQFSLNIEELKNDANAKFFLIEK